MEEKFIITQEIYNNATRYLELATKAVLAKVCAEMCIEKRELEEIEGYKISPWWVLEPLNRELFIAGVLLKYYLKVIETDDAHAVSLSVAELSVGSNNLGKAA